MGKISYVLHIFMLTTLLLDLGFGEVLLYPLIFTPVNTPEMHILYVSL
jgi:hypothetical protein